MSIDLDSLIDTTIVASTDDDVSTLSDMVSPTGNNKLTRCIITGFPDTNDAKYLHPTTYFTNVECIDVWCGQFEISPETNQTHFHVYVAFKHKLRPRFNTIRNIFTNVLHKNVNIRTNKHRPSKKGENCAVNYVLAPSKRAPDTEAFVWQGNTRNVKFDEQLFAKKKTSKEDLKDKQVAYIESKPKWWTWDQIVHENMESKLLLASCNWGSKFHSGRHAETPRRTITNVIILYGAGGTGKTTLALNWDVRENEPLQERYFKRNPEDGKFWGGGRTAYRGQRIIHLEEFCGQETCSVFKEICDIGKHGPSVNIKNSGMELNHETVIITSNSHPAAWYKHLWHKEPKQWQPVARRFTQVWFFPELRNDGTVNAPDESNPPQFIDQTDCFKNMINSYDEALKHSQRYWPFSATDEFTDGISHSSDFNVVRIRGGGPDVTETIFELIGEPENWPNKMSELFAKTDHTHSERFSLVVFLLCNGIDPVMIVEYLQEQTNLNKKQRDHVMQIIKEYPTSSWTSWNMSLGRRL